MKRLLLLLFVLSISIGSWAQIISGVWKYTLAGGNATIVGTTQTSGTDLNIPSKVDGYPVTKIGKYAFRNLSGYTGSLTIPGSVKKIGDYAFANCANLTGSLTIPENVDSVGNFAFLGCAGFTGSLTIPEGVTEIGNGAFQNCSNLIGPLTIPSKLEIIGIYAFAGCAKLTGAIRIPEGVTIIGDHTFLNCSSLTGPLTISKNVTSIGRNAFLNCSNLAGSLTIPEKVVSIGESAFEGCSKLTGSLTIPEGVTIIEGNSFYNCSGLDGSLTIPASVTTIKKNAFRDCAKLTGSLTIPASVTTIGDMAFNGCSNFTDSLIIPAGVKTVGSGAFSACSRLQSVTFASTESITLLGGGLFLNCSELRYIDASSLPASVFSNFNLEIRFRKKNYTQLYLPQGATISSDVPNVVIGNTCQSFRLYENTSLGGGVGANGYGQSGYEYGNAIIKPFTATSAIYTGKSLADNGVYTLYLPYEIKLPAEIEAYTLLSYGSKTAVFTKYTGTLQAYTPYLLRRVGSVTRTLDKTTMSGVSVTKAPDYLNNPNAGTAIDANTGEWKFLGTTNPISNAVAEANRLYVLEADNTWRPVKSANSAGYVRSLRAFLQAPANYSGAPLAFMLDEEDTTTGLETIEAEVKKENVDIYTVEGRFVGRNYESLPSGLYIIGGKKVYKF